MLPGTRTRFKVVGVVSPTLLDVSRSQFALTIVFHMTFPAITVGLSVFLGVVYGVHLHTGQAIYLQIFRFWKRIFAVGFGLGVVSGTVITFELGLNWGRFASATGPILGPIIGMEVVSAFFVEAAFIGVMLYGDGRVKPRTMMVSCCMVALGRPQKSRCPGRRSWRRGRLTSGEALPHRHRAA
jgi:cytochrome d ubiquinol oxidase subunit I